MRQNVIAIHCRVSSIFQKGRIQKVSLLNDVPVPMCETSFKGRLSFNEVVERVTVALLPEDPQ